MTLGSYNFTFLDYVIDVVQIGLKISEFQDHICHYGGISLTIAPATLRLSVAENGLYI